MGFIAPVSGPFAQVGKDMLDGVKLYLEEIGYRAAGRKIELLVEDDEGIPATTLMKGRKLVEKDGVHVVGGVYLTPCGYALAPYIDSKQIPAVLNSGGDDLTQRQRPKWVVRTSTTSSQSMHPFGEYAYQVMKIKKVSSFCPDFAFSWEALGGFQRVFEENGGKIIQKIWFPMITQDFSPYFSQISKEADALYIILGGAFTIKFFKQFQEFGLKGKMPLIGIGGDIPQRKVCGKDWRSSGVGTDLAIAPRLCTGPLDTFIEVLGFALGEYVKVSRRTSSAP